MGRRTMARAVILLLASMLLVCTACTKPKPREPALQPELQVVIPTVQLTPGRTATPIISIQETPTPVPFPTSEVPVVPLPTISPTPTATAMPIPLPTAAPTPIAEEGPSPPRTSFTHVVQPGETLFRIGLKYGIPWQEIAQANGITDPAKVYTGQRLVIPQGEAPVAPPEGCVHVVQPGETLFRIGLKYGIPWQEIAQTNGITDPAKVYTGQRLVIVKLSDEC